nr:MAG TPA: hypothetical protein [Caudoviricetes sp.]
MCPGFPTWAPRRGHGWDKHNRSRFVRGASCCITI